MERKELMNKFSFILELNEKKKKSVLESSILVDKDLEKMRDYFASIKLDDFHDDSIEIKDRVIEYDKKFFKENLPLQKILVFGKDDIPYKANPFKIVKFKKSIDTSYVDYSKILSGKHRGKIGFDGVFIKDNITKLSYGYLGHELVHTQVEKNPNSLTNIYNKEVLSIFVEMIISKSLGKDILDDIMRYRFQNVYECITDLEYIDEAGYTSDKRFQFRCYLSSALKALHLYDIYKSSNRDKRIEILSLVEDVFRDRISVERFLEIMHITYKNSRDVDMVKHYVKKYK